MKKLTDLRPCDHCGGPLTGGLFHVLRFSLAVVKAQAVNEFAGMARFFGGRASAAVVMNFAPAAADAIVVAMDQPDSRALMTEVVLCNRCYCDDVNLAVLAEKRAAAIAVTDTPTAPATTHA